MKIVCSAKFLLTNEKKCGIVELRIFGKVNSTQKGEELRV